MRPYHELLRYILENGVRKPTRAKLASTGEHIDAISVFGYQSRYDLRVRFPAVTTKKLWFHGVKHELLWMLSGSTNIRYLQDNGVHIWDSWGDPNGDIGPSYGAQMRAWPAPHVPEQLEPRHITDLAACISPDAADRILGITELAKAFVRPIDQIAELVQGIKDTVANPTASVGRRLILNLWNVADVPKMKLPPCHCFSQFSVTDGWLSCQMYQRSADAFLGIPFNIAQYALLTHLLAHVTGLKARKFVHTLGDAHIYTNHIDQVKEQLTRDFKPLPTLVLDPSVKHIDDFKAEHIELDGYVSHPALKGEVAI